MTGSVYASVVLSDSEFTFLGKRWMQPFVHFPIVFFFLYTALHNRRKFSSNFLVFHTQEVFYRAFLLLNCFHNSVNFILDKVSKFDIQLGINYFFSRFFFDFCKIYIEHRIKSVDYGKLILTE